MFIDVLVLQLLLYISIFSLSSINHHNKSPFNLIGGFYLRWLGELELLRNPSLFIFASEHQVESFQQFFNFDNSTHICIKVKLRLIYIYHLAQPEMWHTYNFYAFFVCNAKLTGSVSMNFLSFLKCFRKDTIKDETCKIKNKLFRKLDPAQSRYKRFTTFLSKKTENRTWEFWFSVLTRVKPVSFASPDQNGMIVPNIW